LSSSGCSAASKASNSAVNPERDGMLRDDSFTSKWRMWSAEAARFSVFHHSSSAFSPLRLIRLLKPWAARNFS
jgi:hypothetical protein